MPSAVELAREIFQQHGGTLRTSEAIAAGLHPRTLYAMRDAGELASLSRGLYRLASLPPLSDPDLATVAKRIPHGVVCLIWRCHSMNSLPRFLTRSIWHFPDWPAPQRSSFHRSASFTSPKHHLRLASKRGRSTTWQFAFTAQRRHLPTVSNSAIRLGWMSLSKHCEPTVVGAGLAFRKCSTTLACAESKR